MIKYFAAATFLTFTMNQCLAQSSPSDFLPEGSELVEEYKGDLNGDGKEDYIFITSQKKVEDEDRRGIVVLLRNKNTFSLVVNNSACFPPNEDGGVYFPPELWIDVQNGNLIVHFDHGRYGYSHFTFRHRQNDFELIGYEVSDNSGPVPLQITSINFLTRKKLTKLNTYSNEEREEEIFEEIWADVQGNNMIRLTEIEDFNSLEMSLR